VQPCSAVGNSDLSVETQEVDDDEKPEGFWRTLFLLKPEVDALHEILSNTAEDFLLHLQVFTRRRLIQRRQKYLP
jgi:hypothetical protein